LLNPAPVPAVPMFEMLEEKVTGTLTVGLTTGMLPAVRSGAEEEVTVTFVQGEQLLVSSDSGMTPEEAELLLSAHARTEYVPVVVNVTEGEVLVLLPPAGRADIVEEARSVIVPPPLAAVAFWKKLGKEMVVEALPMLEIVEENVSGTLMVAAAGVGAAAVRSGWPAADETTTCMSSKALSP